VDDNDMHQDFAKEIHRLPECRRQLIFRLRRQIAEGTYATDEKLELALERMIDRVALEDEDRRSHR
jgi:hypothetical protein